LKNLKKSHRILAANSKGALGDGQTILDNIITREFIY